MQKMLERDKGALKLASMGWNYAPYQQSEWIVMSMSMSMTYRILRPQEKEGEEGYANPKALRRLSQRFLQSFLPTPKELEMWYQGQTLTNFPKKRIARNSEVVLINGRYWVYDVFNGDHSQRHSYATRLSPDRMMSVSFGMPKYNYNANPHPSTYPPRIKKAFADMQAMVASLRAVNLKTDGKPDPFAVERVAPAPLPAREQRPMQTANPAVNSSTK